MDINQKQKYIEQLAIKTKNGDRDATEELISLFTPLIYKISEQIHYRYGCIFPLDEIVRQGKCCLVHLTVSYYQPSGKAHYPYFIKKQLHAELVKLYRPIYTASLKSIPLDIIKMMPSNTMPIYNNERERICEGLIDYASQILNTREYDVFCNHICSNTPRNDLARKYHISFMRMKQTHQKIIKKLKKYLSLTWGVRSARDI